MRLFLTVPAGGRLHCHWAVQFNLNFIYTASVTAAAGKNSLQTESKPEQDQVHMGGPSAGRWEVNKEEKERERES